ncbi:MAG: ABC transporter ATP-binding protein, partial [Planctomycetes bacterium]|nr:ABC transporter ATP-binding protein [Planctomycetota bacterium]
MNATTANLIRIENLAVDFQSSGQTVNAVKNISFSIGEGETIGLVGESGSGKSVTSLAIMRLIAEPGIIKSGNITMKGKNLLTIEEDEIRKIRGREIAMIFQEPMTCLNPVYTIGNQIMEAVLTHQHKSEAEAYKRCLAALDEVGIKDPALCMKQYPHELSGGMKQRAMIAMAIINKPRLLIADEPTTALDVTVQDQILNLLAKLQKEYGMSMLFITHDLGVVAQVARRVCVMRYGEIVEEGMVEDIFKAPQHPYTIGLFQCLPRLSGERKRLYSLAEQEAGITTQEPQELPENTDVEDDIPLIEVNSLVKHFPIKKGLLGRVA